MTVLRHLHVNDHSSDQRNSGLSGWPHECSCTHCLEDGETMSHGELGGELSMSHGEPLKQQNGTGEGVLVKRNGTGVAIEPLLAGAWVACIASFAMLGNNWLQEPHRVRSNSCSSAKRSSLQRTNTISNFGGRRAAIHHLA